MSKKAQASMVSPEYVLLGMLSLRPNHGYDLHELVSHELGQIWTISLSQTYNILNRLEAQCLIEGSMQEQDKAPPRRCYSLTAAGQERFEVWLHEPTASSAHAIRMEFLTRLYFLSNRNPARIGQIIDAQVASTSATLARLQTILADLPQEQTFNRLGLELRVSQLMSILGWLADCRTQIVHEGGLNIRT